MVQGQPLDTLPADLYIPPDALRVFLENFEGPLDLLLYLIQYRHFDILNIPIAEITRQYLQYVELMKELHLDLAAEYLVMAAILMEIKSGLLLPVPHDPDSDQPAIDPRTRLIQQLQEYARYKQAAQDLDALPRLGRDLLPVSVTIPEIPKEIIVPHIPWPALLQAMQEIMQRVAFFTSHQVLREPLSVRERMSFILETLKTTQYIDFINLFTLEEGRAGVVVTLLAILELVKESLIQLTQLQPFAMIQVTRVEPQ
jgi:segregation and condensation protein A